MDEARCEDMTPKIHGWRKLSVEAAETKTDLLRRIDKNRVNDKCGEIDMKGFTKLRKKEKVEMKKLPVCDKEN